MSDTGAHPHERKVFYPGQQAVQSARISGMDAYRALCAEAEADFTGFWGRLAREQLKWQQPFTRVLDESKAPFFRWFDDGRINVSYNCLDVHVEAGNGDRTAIVFEADDGTVTRVTYADLLARTCRMANALKNLGVKKGDRVVIYMPMSVEGAVAMQACARIGAIHSVVFGGFSANSLRDRINDAGAVVVITADEQRRGGKSLPLKAIVDEALGLGGCETVRNVVVYRRTGGNVAFNPQGDLWMHEIVAGQSDTCEPEWVEAEHPLFLLYTSGSTGRPKGIQHASGGYLLGAKLTTRWAFDLKEDDVFWCTADVGWITGHTYVAYGPLAAGATVVMYEGAPTHPDGGRFWQLCETHGITIFYTAPTAIRALMKLGDEIPRRYDLSKLRLLGSVGEPINPEAWMWYHRTIGGGRCPIVDTWWQTETGAVMMTPMPGAMPTKPGSCARPLPGIFADVVDEEGRSVRRAGAGGYLVIKRPWPSMLRTIWGDNERYVRTYWQKFQNRFYVAGDSAHRDADGYYWIMGRIDDVLNVAGHRLGTMEIESALVAHPRVAEAAVVGKPHEIKGESVFVFLVTKGPRPAGAAAQALVEELRAWVAEQLSPIAKPDDIRLTDNLPKTRSGKIMRRLLRAIARGEEITQDVSTLENPAILEQLRGEPTSREPMARATAGSRARPGSKPRAAARSRPKPRRRPRQGRAAKRRAAPKPRAAGRSPRGAAKTRAAVKRRAPAKTRAAAKTRAVTKTRAPAKARTGAAKRKTPARGRPAGRRRSR